MKYKVGDYVFVKTLKELLKIPNWKEDSEYENAIKYGDNWPKLIGKRSKIRDIAIDPETWGYELEYGIWELNEFTSKAYTIYGKEIKNKELIEC